LKVVRTIPLVQEDRRYYADFGDFRLQVHPALVSYKEDPPVRAPVLTHGTAGRVVRKDGQVVLLPDESGWIGVVFCPRGKCTPAVQAEKFCARGGEVAVFTAPSTEEDASVAWRTGHDHGVAVVYRDGCLELEL